VGVRRKVAIEEKGRKKGKGEQTRASLPRMEGRKARKMVGRKKKLSGRE
jgi:hypothetical protein